MLSFGFALGNLKGLLAQWGYLALFAFVVAGNLGVPVPESSVLWVAGYLAWKGRLRLPLVLVIGIVAAVAGDNLGYWLGRRFGLPALTRYGPWAHLTPQRLQAMQGFVRRYGPVSVFFARFITGLRFLAGPLAGSMGLPPPSFFLANVLGAICYVPITVGEGYAIGYGLGRYVHPLEVEHLLLVGAILIGCLVLGYHLLKRRRNEEIP